MPACLPGSPRGTHRPPSTHPLAPHPPVAGVALSVVSQRLQVVLGAQAMAGLVRAVGVAAGCVWRGGVRVWRGGVRVWRGPTMTCGLPPALPPPRHRPPSSARSQALAILVEVVAAVHHEIQVVGLGGKAQRVSRGAGEWAAQWGAGGGGAHAQTPPPPPHTHMHPHAHMGQVVQDVKVAKAVVGAAHNTKDELLQLSVCGVVVWGIGRGACGGAGAAAATAASSCRPPHRPPTDPPHTHRPLCRGLGVAGGGEERAHAEAVAQAGARGQPPRVHGDAVVVGGVGQRGAAAEGGRERGVQGVQRACVWVGGRRCTVAREIERVRMRAGSSAAPTHSPSAHPRASAPSPHPSTPANPLTWPAAWQR